MAPKEIIRAGAGTNYNYSQDHCFVKVSSHSTQGAFCMVEDHLKPGFFLPRHHHKVMTEVFYVLEGEVVFLFDEETVLAKPGDTITIPPHVWHAASCEQGGKMLTLFQNGRFDGYLQRLSTMNEQDFADERLMSALAAEFDIYGE